MFIGMLAPTEYWVQSMPRCFIHMPMCPAFTISQLYLRYEDKPRFKEALESFMHDPLFLGSWVARRTLFEVGSVRQGVGVPWSFATAIIKLGL